jgi:hypothetical protein
MTKRTCVFGIVRAGGMHPFCTCTIVFVLVARHYCVCGPRSSSRPQRKQIENNTAIRHNDLLPFPPNDLMATAVTITCHPVESNAPPQVVSIRASSRKNRVYVLREFLLQTFALASGDIILDVAGGKGDLSWLLRNVDQIKSVVVDPRITKHKHLQRSSAYLKEHPEEAKARAAPHLPTHQPLAGLIDKLQEPYHRPQHLRLLVNDDLVEALRNYLSTKDTRGWANFWHEALERARDAQPLGYREQEMEESTTILDAQEGLESLLNTKLAIGFHPDQATEACIDLALLLGIAYCVVPCCVFPSEFPDRMTPEGTRVRCYDELIAHLQTKDLSMKTTELSFHETTTARRIVLYRVR